MEKYTCSNTFKYIYFLHFVKIWSYSFDVNMLGENLQTVRENTEVFIEASKDIGLEANYEKTKYMITSRQETVVKNQNMWTSN